MLFNKRDKLVLSIPNFGPKELEGVPSASMFKSANPIAMVESNLEASLLYILLTAFHVVRNEASIVFFLILNKATQIY
jgi:hypothetical protein